MPSKLNTADETVKLELRLPSSLKAKVELMAANQGDGDVSAWARELFRRAWTRYQGGYDCTVETAKGYAFGYVDVAPKASPLPRWEVHELTLKGPRSIGFVDVQKSGSHSFSNGMPPQDRMMLEAGWHALVEKFGASVVARARPRR